GVETDERGAVRVDAQLRSSVPHIWALGDVNGGPQFTYISLDDFRIVRDSLFGAGKRSTADRGAVPYSVFITPSFSRIGLSEDQARQQGRDIKVATLPAAAIPRARVLGDTRGLLKAVVDAQTGQILGVALLCRDAHEMINIVKTAMDAGLPYTRLRDQLFTHPTMSESLNDLFGLIG
ncbi:TPA: FAD-dependent oxidoreductase, partial [Serratia marcescens]